MTRLIPCYLLAASLFANEETQISTLANDPSVHVEGTVNVITGNLSLANTDLVIQGAEPVSISRSYVVDESKADWSIGSFAHAFQKSSNTWVVCEPNGAPVRYQMEGEVKINGKKYLKCTPKNLKKGFSNTWHGEVSSRTNFKNNYIFIEHKEHFRHLIVHAANGTIRTYKKTSSDEVHDNGGMYRLLTEQLPNGNWILYDYREEYDKMLPAAIRSMNPSKTKTYARAEFRYEDPKQKNKDFTVVGSDGQTVSYRFTKVPKNCEPGPLKEVVSSQMPDLRVHYLSYQNEHNPRFPSDHLQRLAGLEYPDQRQVQFDYYYKAKENVAGQTIDLRDWYFCEQMPNGQWQQDFRPNWRRNRIKTLSAPVGSDATLHPTHSFIYHEKLTSVYDIEGNRIDYRYGEDDRLHQVTRYSKEGRLLNAERYIWGNGQDLANLICKIFLDSNEQPLSAKRYYYDSRGNVLEERLYGNLSGQGAPLCLDAFGLPLDGSTEMFSKKRRYSASEPNLLLQEEDDSGLLICYSYVPGTDRPSSQLTYDRGRVVQRVFFEYDADLILTRQIHDNGSSLDPNDLTHVSMRTLQKITPLSSGPYLGLPEVIEELYWEQGREILLKKTVLTYTTGAKIARQDIYDAEGQFRYSLETTYDAKGRPLTQTNALGQTETFAYDNCGNRIYAQDGAKKMTTSTRYDYANRPISIRQEGNDSLAFARHFSYNGKHQLVSEIDPRGAETRSTYNTLGQKIQTQFPPVPQENGSLQSPILSKDYDSAGNEILRIDANGHKTHIKNNIYGKPTHIIYPDGAQETFIYNLDGTLLKQVDARGVETVYIYDVLKQVIRKSLSQAGSALAEEQFEFHGTLLTTSFDAEGNRTEHTYDEAGRKIAEESAGERISYAYDSLGRLTQTQRGDLITIREYDLLDRVVEERNASASGEILRKVCYEYDSAGNQTAIIHSVNNRNAREEFQYDSFNRLIRKVDPLGFSETTHYEDRFLNENGQTVLKITHTDSLGLQTIQTYDVRNQVTSLEQRKDCTLAFEEKLYDLQGQLVLQTNKICAPDHPDRQMRTRWQYDSRGRLTTLIEAEGAPEEKVTHHSYTPTGELAETIQPNGVRFRYDYNGLKQLIVLKSSDGSVDHWMVHNRLGHLIKSDSFERTVDPKGQLLSERFANGLLIEHRYDDSGRRIETKIPQADCLVEYRYNALDLKEIARSTLRGISLYTHRYLTHDLSGNLLETELIGNLGRITYQVDALSRKISLQVPSFSQEVLEYDPVGKIRQMRIQNETVSYGYDDLNQLTSESGLFAHDYLHDSLYNRLQKDEETYKVNSLQQIASHYDYDPNGNPIRQGETFYFYDALNRLVRIEKPDLIQQFTYDCEHRCLAKITFKEGSRKTQNFLCDEKNEIGSFDEHLVPYELRILGNAPHAEIGAAIAFELNGEIYAPIHDLQGNVAALLSLHGPAPSLYRYSAFGEEYIQGTESPWRFSSKRTDAQTGLVYFGRRFYSPGFGRWLTPDPSGFTDGMNLYTYVHNDPLTHFDEYGLMDYGQIERQQLQNDIKDYLGGKYKFEDYYYNYEPKELSKQESSNRTYGEIVLFTGIRTNKEEFKDMVRYVSRLAGNVPIHGIHMPTHGFDYDLGKCQATLKTGMNSTILHGMQYFQEASNRVGPDGKILVLGHSAGAMNGHFSGRNLPKDMRNKLVMHGFAPATIIPRGIFEFSRNYMSSNHDLLMEWHKLFHQQEFNQALKSGLLEIIPAHSNASKFNDHAFMSPTFYKPLSKILETFTQQYQCR